MTFLIILCIVLAVVAAIVKPKRKSNQKRSVASLVRMGRSARRLKL